MQSNNAPRLPSLTNTTRDARIWVVVILAVPVGLCCAQDIDAIFAILRDHIINLYLYSPSQLEKAIRDALKEYQLPVVIKHVDGTRDYAAHYAPHIAPGLKNFSYSEHTNG